MSPCEITAFISSLAICISKSYDDKELAVIAAAFTQLGDSIETILAQRELCNN